MWLTRSRESGLANNAFDPDRWLAFARRGRSTRALSGLRGWRARDGAN
jgi:hypothetical protein